MKKIWITGISGTGKTTVGKKLSQKGFCVIDVDETVGLCCWKNNKTGKVVDYEAVLDKKFTDTHSWTIDEGKLDALIGKTDKLVIIVGMIDALTERFKDFDKVFILRSSPETFISRINQRVDNDFGKEESQQRELLSFYKRYESKLIDMGAISVDAEQSVSDVISDILDALASN
jgi:dephospho-CoA kinase